jgi:hypothetical protein
MNILERWQATFDHSEPDYVSGFVQVIMRRKQQEIDDRYGGDFTEDDLCITPLHDFTLQRWCGFEASWGVSSPYIVHHDMKPPRYWVESNGKWIPKDHLPDGVSRYRVEMWNGSITEIMGDNRDINFYIGGNLYVGPSGAVDQPEYDPKATMDLWDERYEGRTVELMEDATYDRIAKDLQVTLDEFQFMPIFGVSGVAESVRECFGLNAFGRFARKNPEVIEHAVKLHEPAAIASAEATAKAGAPFCCVADDIAYKHGVFVAPDQYKRFFAPLLRKEADIIHQAGGKIFFHSDGYTEPYWPIWIDDCRFDGQESLEPQAWLLPDGEGSGPRANLEKPSRVIRYLKETYGDRFVLLGNMDMSTVLPLASPEDVAWVTKDIIEGGAPGGGFVFACCTDITDSTPLENVIAMREAYRKYRHCYGN